METIQLRGEALIEKRVGRRAGRSERGERFGHLMFVPGVTEEVFKSLEFPEALGVELGEPIGAKRFFSHDSIIAGEVQIFRLRRAVPEALFGAELLCLSTVARSRKKTCIPCERVGRGC